MIETLSIFSKNSAGNRIVIPRAGVGFRIVPGDQLRGYIAIYGGRSKTCPPITLTPSTSSHPSARHSMHIAATP